MPGIFFYTIGIAFTSGIFIRSFFDIGNFSIVYVCIVGIALIVTAHIYVEKSVSYSPIFIIGIAVLATSVGMWRLQIAEMSPPILAAQVENTVSLTGPIVREPEMRETTIHLYVAVEDESRAKKEHVLVTVDTFAYTQTDLSYGDVVRVEGVLKKPEAFATNGGRMFDYPGYLKAHGVIYTVPFAKVEILHHESGTFLGSLFRSKEAFEKVVESYITEPYAGLGEGVLLGVKRALGADLERTFRETGIIHIVVLSGYNIMIIVEGLMFVLARFFFPRTRMILGVLCIAVFALLVGLSATVVRASIMAVLLLIARTTGRIYAVLRALMFAGVVMLVINPYLLVHDPGFQLSFLAALGLIFLSPHIEKRLIWIPSRCGVREVVTATLATQIFVLPLLLYHMGMLSLVSVVVNVLVLPIVPGAMFLTFLTGSLGMVWSAFGYVLGYLAYLALGYIILVAELFGSLSFAVVSIDAFPFWIVLGVYVGYIIMLSHLIFLETTEMRESQTCETYTDWVIEEEKETSPEEQSSSGEVPPFPFR